MKKAVFFSVIFVLTIFSSMIVFSITAPIDPDLETRPVYNDQDFDADDPAIWVNKKNRDDNMVICTLIEEIRRRYEN